MEKSTASNLQGGTGRIVIVVHTRVGAEIQGQRNKIAKVAMKRTSGNKAVIDSGLHWHAHMHGTSCNLFRLRMCDAQIVCYRKVVCVMAQMVSINSGLDRV